MSELQRTETRQAERPASTRPVLTALRDLDGRATLGDVVAATGLARDQAEASLRELLEERRGHLAVGQEGTLVYEFEPRFIRRDAVSVWEKFKEGAWSLFKTGFKIWIVLMLVVYFVVFLALLIAAIFASDDDSGLGDIGGGGRGHGHRGGVRFPSFWFWYFFWTPDWYWGRPYYGERWEKGRKVKVPFYKKVFSFVFGPDRPRPTLEQRDRSVLRLIRSRRGVLTAAELVQHTGAPLAEAEEEMARLMVTHGGDARVSDEGEVVYVFPELMVSAHGRVAEREPDPAWRRLEPKLSVTGNSTGTNVLVGGINAFNLVAAATAPLFIFPRLGFSGTAAWIGLVWVPLVFSTMFFGIPLARWWGVARENVRRAARNVRKVLLGFVSRATLVGDGAQPVRPGEAAAHVTGTLKDGRATAEDVEEELVRLTAEFDGEVSATDDGGIEYRFEGLRHAFVESEKVRREMGLEEQEVGDIVYSSADDVQEQGRRDLEAFDRALASAAPAGVLGAGEGDGDEADPSTGLDRFVRAPGRVGYLDDFELVAFDEEMEKRRRKARSG